VAGVHLPLPLLMPCSRATSAAGAHTAQTLKRLHMKRAIVLAALLTTGALSLTMSAYQAGQAAPKVVTVDKIKDNLFVLKGGGGNTAVFVTASGVTVVDTKVAGWGQPILSKIKELTPKPVTTVINTHSHGDHVSGNVEFPASVEIVAHQNTKSNIEAWPPVYGVDPNMFPNVVKESGGKGIPKKTYTDRLTLGSGDDRVELFYFGRGHTGGDSWVVFPALGVMHTGDMFPNKGVPVLDRHAGGSGLAFPDTITKALAGIKGVETLITGHLPVTVPRADLQQYAEFTRDFVAMVRDAKQAGKSADDIVASYKVPEKYAGYTAAPVNVRNAAQVVLDELK
jgi:glyoxylase-like metal-dependent hydrolase (beta-lactamase superfamily II)